MLRKKKKKKPKKSHKGNGLSRIVSAKAMLWGEINKGVEISKTNDRDRDIQQKHTYTSSPSSTPPDNWY